MKITMHNLKKPPAFSCAEMLKVFAQRYNITDMPGRNLQGGEMLTEWYAKCLKHIVKTVNERIN